MRLYSFVIEGGKSKMEKEITFIEVWLFILTILVIVLYGCVLYG